MAPAAGSLLGLPVRHRELRLGTVATVLVSPRDETVVAMIVSSAWGGPDRLLPLPAAFVKPGAIECAPLALLAEEEAVFYERRGARRVSATVGRLPGRLHAA